MTLLSQKQIQSLLQKLSPHQIQMIKLLELPAMQLEQRIKQEIEENPVLDDSVAQTEEGDQEEREKKEVPVDYTTFDDTPAYKYRTNNYSRDDNNASLPLAANGLSMRGSLIEQLEYFDLSDREKTLATYIVESIDDDGYLHRDLSSIADDIAFSVGIETDADELGRLLDIVHRLEPAGIGARDLQECLLLQLRAHGIATPAGRLAEKILSNNFEEFKRKHYDKLMSRLGVTQEQLQEAIEEITRLSPKPGNLFNDGHVESTPYVTPDFVLDYSNGEFTLNLTSYNIPHIRISNRYLDMIRHASAASNEQDMEALQFVKNKIDSAKWFIKALRQRRDTLLRTMTEILDYQRDYFVDGDVSLLKPMILKDIADRTNLDVSTISRVVNSKYVQTHFGTIPLKQLFSEALETDDGQTVSTYVIKEIMQECLADEDKRNPLTDEELMDKINARGYRIARRTVAKYREMLGIPVARLRKSL